MGYFKCIYKLTNFKARKKCKGLQSPCFCEISLHRKRQTKAGPSAAMVTLWRYFRGTLMSEGHE